MRHDALHYHSGPVWELIGALLEAEAEFDGLTLEEAARAALVLTGQSFAVPDELRELVLEPVTA